MEYTWKVLKLIILVYQLIIKGIVIKNTILARVLLKLLIMR